MDTAGAARYRPGPCPRDRRHDRRLCDWSGHAVLDPRGILRGSAVLARAQAWAPDRHCGRTDKFRTVSRLAERARNIDVRCDCTVLAALGRHLDRPGDLLRRSDAVRLFAVALFRRPARQLEPGLDHVCTVRIRLPVRVRRPSNCRAACVRYRRADALRTTTILRKLPLYGHPEGNCN